MAAQICAGYRSDRGIIDGGALVCGEDRPSTETVVHATSPVNRGVFGVSGIAVAPDAGWRPFVEGYNRAVVITSPLLTPATDQTSANCPMAAY